MECRTGQSVGDKGTCTGSEVCVQIADKCKKKHPGVFCSCGAKQSNLGVSSTSLVFDKKSRKGSFTVSNTGNVPLDITIAESGDTDVFAIQETRKCRKKTVSPAEWRGIRALLAPTSTAIVPPQGCASYRVRFKAKKKGVYSERLDIQSDATTPPTEGAVNLSGSLGKPGTGQSTTTTTTTLPTCGGVAANMLPPGTTGADGFQLSGSINEWYQIAGQCSKAYSIVQARVPDCEPTCSPQHRAIIEWWAHAPADCTLSSVMNPNDTLTCPGKPDGRFCIYLRTAPMPDGGMTSPVHVEFTGPPVDATPPLGGVAPACRLTS